MDIVPFILWVTLIAVGIFTVLGTFFTVEQQTVRVVERFGRFSKMGRAGLNFKVPLIDSVSAPFDMKLQQLTVSIETKTKDNVFVQVDVAVQYEPIPDKVYEAYYRLQDPKKQITSYVFDVIRSQVPILNLDDVFLQKDEIALAVAKQLEASMTNFGYMIEKVLVIDVNPDDKVQASMNEINAAQRLQEAAKSKAEANKIIIVKQAEADAEAKALQGKGVADERKAIVEGLRESITEAAEGLGVDAKDVMQLVLFTQYTDMLREVGKASNTIMLPSGADGMSTIMAAIAAGTKN